MSKHNASEGSNSKSASPSALSTAAALIVATAQPMKGRWVSVLIQSEGKNAAAFKHLKLRKESEMVVRLGVDYANIGEVKEGIANGERGEVQPLPASQHWVAFPYIIANAKGQEYVRLTMGSNTPPKCRYFVDAGQGEVEVSRDTYNGYQIPSAYAEKDAPLVISVKIENLLRIG